MEPWMLVMEAGGPVVILGAVWRLRGWVDNLREMDQELARQILHLDDEVKRSAQETHRRLTAIERKLS